MVNTEDHLIIIGPNHNYKLGPMFRVVAVFSSDGC